MPHAGRFPRVLLPLLGAVAAAVGCGGGSGENADAGGDGGVQLTPADQTFIADFCAAIMPCCATNGRTANVAVCKESMAKLGWSRDPQVRSACLDELRRKAAMRTCMPDGADLGGPCARLFNEPSGPRAPGETCATAAECAGSPGTVTSCYGICVTYALGAEGDYPCVGNAFSSGFVNTIPWKNGSNSPASHAFLCQQRADLVCGWNDNRCKPVPVLPGLGEPCNVDCAGDNYCNAICTPKLAADLTCSDSVQCAGDCAGSDLCSGTCVEGACSPLTAAQFLLLGVFCGTTPVTR